MPIACPLYGASPGPLPGLARVAVLKNSINPIHILYWQTIEPAAQQLALELQALEIRAPEDFEPTFAAAKRKQRAGPSRLR